MALEINKSPDHADEVVALCNTLGDVKAELQQVTKERDELFDVAEKLYEALNLVLDENNHSFRLGGKLLCVGCENELSDPEGHGTECFVNNCEQALSLAKQHGLGKDKQ